MTPVHCPDAGTAPLVDGASRIEALARKGRRLEALCALAETSDRQLTMDGLARALHGRKDLLGCADLQQYYSILGHGFTMTLELSRALRWYRRAGDREGVRRLHRLGVLLGRRSLVDEIEPLLEPGQRLQRDARRAFLLERALPSVKVGGDVDQGFWVDEEELAQIAGELGEEPAPLMARAARQMLDLGSRSLAKLLVLARLGEDEALLGQVEPAIGAAMGCPRARLTEVLEEHLEAHGGRIADVIQRGDVHDHNPLSATLWLVERRGRQVVFKENLRLPVDFSRVDGYSAEREVLESVAGLAHVARLLEVVSLHHHELLVLERAPGYPLARHTRPSNLLPAAEALRICAVVAGVLESLHQRSLVYMDVKARNLVYDGGASGELTLVDFGMARRLPRGAQTVTSLLSTPAYVPPEMGREFEAGQPADVFQLGIMLHELLVGQHPLAIRCTRSADLGREDQLIRSALANLLLRPRLDAPQLQRPGLRDLLEAMLHRSPSRRPGAGEVRAALEGMLP